MTADGSSTVWKADVVGPAVTDAPTDGPTDGPAGGPADAPTGGPPSPWAGMRIDLRRIGARLRADAAFLLARLLFGLWAWALLAVGGALALAAAFMTGFTLVFVLPFILGAVAAGWLLSLVLARVSVTVRGWMEGRPFRRGIAWAATASARALAGVAVWWLLACRAAARRQRTRIAAQRGIDIPLAYRPLTGGHVRTLRVVVGDQATWRDLLYLVVAPAYSAATWLLIGFVTAGALSMVESAISELSWRDPEAWLGVALGVGLLVGVPFLIHVVARGAAFLAVALLSIGESARMRAELDEQRLRRQLAVDAAERERRRIERDLHDGAQQRLVALGISLGMAQEVLPTDPAAGAELVAEAHAEAKLALAELRDLARGIHPAILGDRGLDAALSALVRRAHIPVSIIVVTPRRAPASVESAAYFVVAEALTNVSRHAGASRATVEITQDDELLVVEVSDDGAGGADPRGGTGLHGLAERVGALGGSLTVDSPAGGPTTIRAEIPCAW